MKKAIFPFVLFFIFCINLKAQTFYVDSKNGNDLNPGNIENPLKSIDKAVDISNKLTGTGNLVIKLLPGIYMLNDKVTLNPVRLFNDSTNYILEAAVMPNDNIWDQSKMPIIQSYAENNSVTMFPHSVGIYVASNNVVIRGIKFLGNANPNVKYYYPINRENKNLSGLQVSQCYFIGNKNANTIQGGIWALGNNIDINHCVFKECRNAILLFGNGNNCSVNNNLISHAYESAFWIQTHAETFAFTQNIVSNSEYFWVRIQGDESSYELTNSIICNNKHFLGEWNNEKFRIDEINSKFFNEKDIVNKGVIQTIERENDNIPNRLLHLSPKSIGYKLSVGIFKTNLY